MIEFDVLVYAFVFVSGMAWGALAAATLFYKLGKRGNGN